MCYHVSTPDKTALQKDLPELEIIGDFQKNWHISGFSRPALPTTLNENTQQVVSAWWKLLPFWVTNEEEAAKYANTLNADSTEIFEKKSYSRYILKYRGVLWVDAFYEPQKIKGVKETDNYLIYKPDRTIFPLGIVYAPWKNQDTGEVKNTFAVITVDPNPFVQEIHHRMPLILNPNNLDKWMNCKTKDDVKSFFSPYDGELQAHKTYRVTGARGENTNRPDIQNQID
jgi:putative SOS response-associated peptidase YedK